MRILKFGGTSVSTATRRVAVADIVRRAQRRGPVTVVTSALAGITDLLFEALNHAISGGSPKAFLGELRDRHLSDAGGTPAAVAARHQLVVTLAELEALLTGVALLGECPPGARQRCLAAGERLAMPLVVAELEKAGLEAAGVDGSELLVASRRDHESEPVLDLEASRSLIQERWRNDGRIKVVTGFIAGDGDGGTVTLGRGASDLSATLLANFLGAEAVEIWSDVDGMLAAPPRWVPEALPLAELSYAEADGLASFGADILHPAALEPAAAAGIPVRIRNTLNPAARGTRIDDRADGAAIRAVSLVPSAKWRGRDVALVAVVGGVEMRTVAEMSKALRRLSVEPVGWIDRDPSRALAAVVVVAPIDGPRTVKGLYEALVHPRSGCDVSLAAVPRREPQAEGLLRRSAGGIAGGPSPSP